MTTRTGDHRPGTLLGRLSIRRKLILISLLVSLLAVSVAGAVMVIYQLRTFRQRFIEEQSTLAAVTSVNVTASLAFNDSKDAAEILSSLRASPSIIRAWVLSETETAFASYSRDPDPAPGGLSSSPPWPVLESPPAEGYRFYQDHLFIFAPILLDQDRALGTLCIQAELVELQRFLGRSISVLALTMVLSCAVAFELSRRLRRVISGPLDDLAETARKVSETRDYSLRALVNTSDELGVLGNAFNDMLDQIRIASDAVQTSEEKYRTLIEAMQDGVFLIQDSVFKYANEPLARMMGKTVAELSGTDFRTVVAPEDREMVADRHFRRLQGEADVPTDYEYRVLAADSRKKVFVNVTANLTTFRGRAALIGTMKDVTQRKLAEENLRRERRLFVGGPVVVFRLLAAPGWPVEYVSPNVTELFGFSAEQFSSGEILYSDTLHPADCERVFAEVRAHSAAGHETFQREYRIVRHDHEVRWLHDFTVVVRDEEKGITNYEGYVVDATKRIQAEQEIRKLNIELEQRVADRTAELTAVNRELEAFCYSVSHDLRSPLRSIDGFSQALLEDYGEILDATGREYLARARAASQRMGQLIDDLLGLSRVTRREMVREDVDLSALATAVLNCLAEADPGRQVRRQITQGLRATGDAGLLRVVLENLLGNAWKFTAKRHGAAIGFDGMEFEGNPVFFVRDNGAGFDMTYGDTIFKAFQRLHPAKEFEGTGIGLTTVQRIIQRHGGRVWAESVVGEGATFYFTL